MTTKTKLERNTYWLNKEKDILERALKVGKKRYDLMIKTPELIEPEFEYEKDKKYWKVVKEAMKVEYDILEREHLFKIEQIENQLKKVDEELKTFNYAN